ncbi:hypothetical protein HPB48_007622 [Haemaphysalis longicornis]|uniref:Protein Wnt n=1 Tax=Haemaphysalis longicornis TaxID=44386 RepID=A0A9J6G3Y3_HAELO|nr:hypothetical protein HPB48_007622 [Haemaphysalis longicornis]
MLAAVAAAAADRRTGHAWRSQRFCADGTLPGHVAGAHLKQSGPRSNVLAPVPSCPCIAPREVSLVGSSGLASVTWTGHSTTGPPRVSDMRALLVSVCLYFNHATMASIGLLSRSKPILLDSDHEASVRHFCRHHWKDPRVRSFCVSEPAVIHTIVQGMRTTVKNCLSLFEWERWQCDLLRDRKKLLRKVYRETAFVYALTAAGMAHSVAQSCRLGRLSRRCSCAKADGSSGNDEQMWKWAGCGDNRPFAAKFSRRLLSRPHSFRRPRTLRKPIDMHNIAVGIRVLKHGSRQVCKCHGVSGSCSVKTCWRELAPFPEVALRLKRKYETAVNAQLENKPAFAPTDVLTRPRKGPAGRPDGHHAEAQVARRRHGGTQAAREGQADLSRELALLLRAERDGRAPLPRPGPLRPNVLRPSAHDVHRGRHRGL